MTTKASQREVLIPNNLICNVQSLGIGEDCNAPLVSDGKHWHCPFGHIQYRKQNGEAVRGIRDHRTTIQRDASGGESARAQ